MDFLPIVLFWAFAIWGLVSRKLTILLFLFFGSMPFGSFAAIPTFLTAGLTFTATPLVALMIIWRALATPSGLRFVLSAAGAPNKMLMLFVFAIVACVTAIFSPRLFAGAVDVIPIRGILSEPAPLRPTAQNISQLTYLTISILTIVAFAFLLRSYEMRQTVLRALVFGGIMTIVTGALDFANQFAPLDPILAPFRTATYSLATDVIVLGGKRVVGLMPESSAFGGVCLSFLVAIYFLRRAMDPNLFKDQQILLLVAALVMFAWLSKSSGTMASIFVFGSLVVCEWYWYAQKRNSAKSLGKQLQREARTSYFLVISVLLVAIAAPVVLDPLIEIFERMVLNKASSHSFEERGLWRQVAWEAALSTYGIGVGVGATRASSTVVSIIAQTGFIGAILFYGFVLQTYLRSPNRSDPDGAAILMAFRFAFLPDFVLSFLIGGVDFGGFNAFLLGLAAAASHDFRSRAATSSMVTAPTNRVVHG